MKSITYDFDADEDLRRQGRSKPLRKSGTPGMGGYGWHIEIHTEGGLWQ